MTTIRHALIQLVIATAILFPLGGVSSLAYAASAEGLNQEANQTLQSLYKTNPAAESISRDAKAILVFPHILKAGFIFGGGYGEGVLIKDSQFAGYYNSVSASWGWQVGAESYGYVVFLMSEKALQYLDESMGWELGVGPTVVVVDEGVARNLSSSTLRNDAYAFIFDQKGIMASLSVEGTKISRIKR